MTKYLQAATIALLALAVPLLGLLRFDSVSPLKAATAPSTPTFEQYQAYAVGSWPESVAVGDFTGDGRNDVVLSTSFYFDAANDYKLFLFVQAADGSLAAPIKLATNGQYGDWMALASGDLNNDGLADVALATSNGIDIFYQSGDTLSPAVLVPTPAARDVDITDVTGDGLPDIVVNATSGVLLLPGTAQGFGLPRMVTSQTQGEVEVGDVTADGRIDVVGFTGHTVHVFSQQADGSFSAAADYDAEVGYWPLADGIEVADVTADSRADVIMTIGGNRPGSLINVFAQNEQGTLNPPTVYSSYDCPDAVEALDMNGDGRMDVVTLHGGWVKAGLYVQLDNGTLAPETLLSIPYASHYRPNGLALGDISGDDLPDIVLADYNYGLVVLRQFIDTTPPQTSILSGPPALTNQTTAAFTFTSNEPSSSFECSLDGAPFSPCTSGQAYSGLTDGSHTFEVRAIDQAGNIDPTPAVWNFEIDTAPPDTTITSGPTGTVNSRNVTFTFVGNESDVRFQCALDSVSFAPCESPKSYSGLSEASHSFRVRAIDRAGNVDPTPAVATFDVVVRSDLATSIAATPPRVRSGTRLTYTITIQNVGPAANANVWLSDVLPSSVGFLLVSVDQGSCVTPALLATGTLTCSLGLIPSGSSVTVRIVVLVYAGGRTTISNTASATSTQPDPDPTNNSATVSTNVFGRRW